MDPRKQRCWGIRSRTARKEYLHRYLWQYDFLCKSRKLNDGERTVLAIKAAEGKGSCIGSRAEYNRAEMETAFRNRAVFRT